MPVFADDLCAAFGQARPGSWAADFDPFSGPPVVAKAKPPQIARLDAKQVAKLVAVDGTSPLRPPGGEPGGDRDRYVGPACRRRPGRARMIGFDDFAPVQLKVALVRAAVRVPKADKLLQLTVDVGEPEPRTIVAGIAASYPEPEALVGKRIVVVANLAPARAARDHLPGNAARRRGASTGGPGGRGRGAGHAGRSEPRRLPRPPRLRGLPGRRRRGGVPRRRGGVDRIVVVGLWRSRGNFGNALELARSRPSVFAATAGIHPHECARVPEADWRRVRAWPPIRPWSASARPASTTTTTSRRARCRRRAFVAPSGLRTPPGSPLVVHVREAEEDCVAILRDEGVPAAGGVIHCFTGDRAAARAYLDLGLHISVAGIVTFKTAGEIREAVRLVPRDRLLVETDSPFLAPVPFRGKRNEPAHVVHVASKVAEVWG